jgi:hypothetical protein
MMVPFRARLAPAVLAGCLCIAVPSGPAATPAAAARSCAPVVDPYAGTRYEGVDLTRIRATGVSCTTARRVARGAHRKALGLPVTGPVKRLTWNGWRVSGDLRGERDSYVARKGDDVVRWRF